MLGKVDGGEDLVGAFGVGAVAILIRELKDAVEGDGRGEREGAGMHERTKVGLGGSGHEVSSKLKESERDGGG